MYGDGSIKCTWRSHSEWKLTEAEEEEEELISYLQPFRVKKSTASAFVISCGLQNTSQTWSEDLLNNIQEFCFRDSKKY